MASHIVLEEALSISERVSIFNQTDKNPYFKLKEKLDNRKIRNLVTIARGSSDCAALYASYLFGKSLGITTCSLPPSIITKENSVFDFSDSLVLVISQSGLSEDLIECERASRKMGGTTLILTNNSDSPIVNNANYFFNMNAGEEKGIAATKSFILTILNLIKLVSILSDNKENLYHILELPEYINGNISDEWDPELFDNEISKGFVISRGLGYALSTEISLKFKEFCLELIEPFSSAEVMHGPITLIDNSFKILTLSLNDTSGKSVLNDISNIKKHTHKLCSIKPDSVFGNDLSYKSINSPEIDSMLIMSKFYPWIIKYCINKGLNPDQPRYLINKVVQTC